MLSFLKTFIKSLRYAARGFFYVLAREPSFQVQVAAATLVLAAAFFLPLERWERVVLVLVVFFVLVLELLNTMVEHLVDIIKPRLHHYAEIVKDIVASAVLLASLAALLVGLLIFLPHLLP